MVNAKVKAKHFCSRECASAGSVTEHRLAKQSESGLRHKGNLLTTAETLRLREAWKYTEVAALLTSLGLEFQFEYDHPPFVYDLYLPQRRLVVEFDAPNHDYGPVLENDAQKETAAVAAGLRLVRIRTEVNVVISTDELRRLLTD